MYTLFVRAPENEIERTQNFHYLLLVSRIQRTKLELLWSLLAHSLPLGQQRGCTAIRASQREAEDQHAQAHDGAIARPEEPWREKREGSTHSWSRAQHEVDVERGHQVNALQGHPVVEGDKPRPKKHAAQVQQAVRARAVGQREGKWGGGEW